MYRNGNGAIFVSFASTLLRSQRHRQRRVRRQAAQHLHRAVGVGIPVALVPQLGQHELLPRAIRLVADEPRDGLRLGHLPQGGDVADEVDAEADGVAGQSRAP